MALLPIVIIEDDLDQLAALTAMLSREPYPLLTAMTGERALDVLREIIPALVVIDIIMPDVPGQQIIRYIRADDRLGKTKILVITSHLGYISELDRRLVDSVLVKPIQTVQLLQAARELLER